MQPLLIWDVEVLLRELLLLRARLQLSLGTHKWKLHCLCAETRFQLRARTCGRPVALRLRDGLAVVLTVQPGQG